MFSRKNSLEFVDNMNTPRRAPSPYRRPVGRMERNPPSSSILGQSSLEMDEFPNDATQAEPVSTSSSQSSVSVPNPSHCISEKADVNGTNVLVNGKRKVGEKSDVLEDELRDSKYSATKPSDASGKRARSEEKVANGTQEVDKPAVKKSLFKKLLQQCPDRTLVHEAVSSVGIARNRPSSSQASHAPENLLYLRDRKISHGKSVSLLSESREPAAKRPLLRTPSPDSDVQIVFSTLAPLLSALPRRLKSDGADSHQSISSSRHASQGWEEEENYGKPVVRNLPLLETPTERELLGDVFNGWAREVNSFGIPSAGRSATSPELPSERMHVHMSGLLPLPNIYPPSASPDTARFSSSQTPRRGLLPEPSTASDQSSTRIRRASSEFLDLDNLMRSLPDDGSWKVSRHDMMRGNGYYLQEKEFRQKPDICTRCAEPSRAGHVCPGSYCALCRGTDHTKEKCPYKTSLAALVCERCGHPGHLEGVCNEVWRQYHSTIALERPLSQSPPRRINAYCSNCGNPGHFAHDCRKRPFDKHSFSIPSPLVRTYHKSLQKKTSFAQFAQTVRDNMSDWDSEMMSATYEHKKASTKRLQRAAQPGTPKKRTRHQSKGRRWQSSSNQLS